MEDDQGTFCSEECEIDHRAETTEGTGWELMEE
jgi:hypothetical protein